MKEELKLSLCMIVRNEESHLGRCLESVKDIVDEIIIVDTGSNDRTREIALEWGATVLDFAWNDHFADARNYGLERASGDWILWLDADEEVDEAGKENLRSVLKIDGCQLASLQVVNYYGELPPEYNRSHLMSQYRLFQNSSNLRFRGAIHEQLNIEGLELTSNSITALPVTLHHYGYLEETIQLKDKAERNLRLLKKELEVEDHDPWLDYHYASELYRCGELTESFDAVNHAIGRFLKEDKKPPSLLYKLKYSILMALGSFKGGWPGIELAVQLYPDYVDLHFYKGIILLQMKEYVKALETFRHCLELGDDHITHLTMVGAGSFHAWYYIGRCHEALEDLEPAKDAYHRTLELAANHSDARVALDSLEVAE